MKTITRAMLIMAIFAAFILQAMAKEAIQQIKTGVNNCLIIDLPSIHSRGTEGQHNLITQLTHLGSRGTMQHGITYNKGSNTTGQQFAVALQPNDNIKVEMIFTMSFLKPLEAIWAVIVQRGECMYDDEMFLMQYNAQNNTIHLVPIRG